MIIRWLGHSCFEIEGQYTKVITDPYNNWVQYPRHYIGADYVTVSHHHGDHDDTSWIYGCEIIDGIGEFKYPDITFYGIQSYHDKKEGALRGTNNIYKFEIDDITFCHLGDLGHMIDDKIWRKLDGIDVLFVPVGGTYTIDATEARYVINALNPYLAIGMHFKNDACSFDVSTDYEFLRMTNGIKVDDSRIEFTKSQLFSSRHTIIMDWVKS
jgi:L-ascorbate metabolism protein UlaG (beta-lactamase superfamily)